MFRFSTRDLLWLTLVVALGLGWFLHQRQLKYKAEIEITHWQNVARRWEDIADVKDLRHTLKALDELFQESERKKKE